MTPPSPTFPRGSLQPSVPISFSVGASSGIRNVGWRLSKVRISDRQCQVRLWSTCFRVDWWENETVPLSKMLPPLNTEAHIWLGPLTHIGVFIISILYRVFYCNNCTVCVILKVCLLMSNHKILVCLLLTTTRCTAISPRQTSRKYNCYFRYLFCMCSLCWVGTRQFWSANIPTKFQITSLNNP